MSDDRPDRPAPLNVQIENVPDTLTDKDQWVCWRYEFDDDRDEWTKIPVDVSGGFASSTDPDTWVSFQEAADHHTDESTDTDGIGFVATEGDMIVGGDLDDCRDPDSGELEDWAADVLEAVDTYAEVSPSGTGLRWFGVGRMPDGKTRSGIEGAEGHFEMYQEGRYLTVTGHHADLTPSDVQTRPEQIESVHDEYIAENDTGEDTSTDADRGGSTDHDLDDNELIQKAKNAENGEKFTRLWEGNTAGYESQSEADLALCSHLAFWTGGDERQIDQLFRESGLYRDKWDADRGEKTYGERTISKALEGGGDYYDPDSGRKDAEPLSSHDYQTQTDDSDGLTWQDVRDFYQFAEQEQNATKGSARKAAADVLEAETSWMYVLESEQLWVYDGDSGQYRQFGASTATHRLESELGAFYAESERREVIGRLEARNQVHRDVLNARDRDDPLLCVKNGVINLRTGERTEHSPEYHFVRGLDVGYEPADADPEKVIDFLDQVTQREADRDTLLDHLAHGLMPGHPYRAFVVCYGPGGNGKTQVSELFRGFVGSENAAAVEIDELADGDFATGDLPGTFINWGDDMAGDGGGQLSDLSLLKKATGGSEIRANEKYEKTFNFKNEAAMFFSANEPPRIGEQKASIQDRIYPIEMPYRFKSDPDQDDPMEKQKVPNVSKKLLDDDAAMRGLLMLAVSHAQELIDSRGEYSQPETPEERLEKYNRSADPIVKFAGRALQEAPAEYKIRKDDAYRVFRDFAESWEERSASERGFKRQLPGATTFDMEGARSRALASPDDGEERVTCWKRVQWSDVARKQMPEWMVERYSDHFENGETADKRAEEPGEGGSNPTLNELEPGRHTFEATVAEQLEPKPWLQGEGTLVDDGELLDYTARGDNNPLSTADEGDRVQIKNAKVTTDRDGLKVLEVTGVCEVTVLDTKDADQTSVDDAAEAAATDGGESDESEARADSDLPPSLIQNATENINVDYDSDDELTAPAFAGRHGLSPEQGKAVLEHLTAEKGLLERLDDGYRVL